MWLLCELYSLLQGNQMMKGMAKISWMIVLSALLSMVFLFATFASHAKSVAHPIFSKVIFFGDSLSDVGNNQDGASDNSPETNKLPDGNGGYRPGDVWVVPFVNYLYQQGYLASENAMTIRPSIWFDQNKEINPAESIDFAYSGDPSGGYDSNNQLTQIHPLKGANSACISSRNIDPSTLGMNAYCGVLNRADHFLKNSKINHYVDPNALYVIWVGPNDIEQQMTPELMNEIGNGYLDLATLNALAGKVIRLTIFSIVETVEDLKNSGAKYFVVINLPNLAYTPQGFLLNEIYTAMTEQPDVINQLFKTLTDNFNSALATQLAYTNFPYITQPDLTTLFNLIHDGEFQAFPPTSFSVNKTEIHSWKEMCCINYLDTQNYDPRACNPQSDAGSLCSGPMPKLANGQGYYAFYNSIHPTTCADQYIA